jgi:ferredoxin--NADP+ reductase
VAHMISDGAGLATRMLPDRDAIINVLHNRGVQTVSFDDWKQLDDVEMARGVRRDAPRDKIVDVETMLSILGQR